MEGIVYGRSMMMQSPPKLNHEGLSMEERRARNMQRNQEFLENLMKTIQHEATGDQSTEINEAANPLSLKEPFEEVASRDSQALDALCRLSHKNEVLPLFNHRECQISSIYSYLERFSIMVRKCFQVISIFDLTYKTGAAEQRGSLPEFGASRWQW